MAGPCASCDHAPALAVMSSVTGTSTYVVAALLLLIFLKNFLQSVPEETDEDNEYNYAGAYAPLLP